METVHNTYFALRHGQSKANVAGIILSDLEDGKKDEWTLTTEGEKQVHESIQAAKTQGLLDATTIIISSPFSRARRTAEIAMEELSTSAIHFDDRLRERWFGDFEKTYNHGYEKVWEEDKKNPTHTLWHTESAIAVQERMANLVEELEKIHAGKTILLVSHGDPFMILQTWFRGQSAATHRDFPYVATAEIRKLERS